MGYYETVSAEAKSAAKEYTINPDKEEAFLKGVMWVVKKLERMVDNTGPLESMLDDHTKKYLNNLSVNDVRRLCSDVKKFEERK